MKRIDQSPLKSESDERDLMPLNEKAGGIDLPLPDGPKATWTDTEATLLLLK